MQHHIALIVDVPVVVEVALDAQHGAGLHRDGDVRADIDMAVHVLDLTGLHGDVVGDGGILHLFTHIHDELAHIRRGAVLCSHIVPPVEPGAVIGARQVSIQHHISRIRVSLRKRDLTGLDVKRTQYMTSGCRAEIPLEIHYRDDRDGAGDTVAVRIVLLRLVIARVPSLIGHVHMGDILLRQEMVCAIDHSVRQGNPQKAKLSASAPVVDLVSVHHVPLPLILIKEHHFKVPIRQIALCIHPAPLPDLHCGVGQHIDPAAGGRAGEHQQGDAEAADQQQGRKPAQHAPRFSREM